MNRTAIIFDLDGTLWETSDSTYVTLNQAAKNHGYDKELTKEMIFSNYGNNIVQGAQHFFPDLDQDLAIEILNEADELNVKVIEKTGGYLYPGLEEALFNLQQNYDLYIVSNTATKKYIESFLISTKLFKYFKDYVAASEIILSKGNAVIKLMDDYYIEKAIYVGDTEKDMEAAEVANIPFVHCLYGFGKDMNCKYKINDISELPNEIEHVVADFNN